MNIKRFVKIKETVDLVDKTGGGSNSTFVQNKIHDIVLEGLADDDTEESIKERVEHYLQDYEVQTIKLELETENLMKKWGFSSN